MGLITEVKESDSGSIIPEVPIEEAKNDTSKETNKAADQAKSSGCNGSIDQNETIIKTTISAHPKSEKALPSPADIELDDDEDEDEDETIAERLIGLTEMFPDSLRHGVCALSSSTLSLVKGAYSLSRKIVWIGVSTSVILFAPVMFELERFNVEEMVKQDRNRLVLGPGSAMSGSPGMAPSPSL